MNPIVKVKNLCNTYGDRIIHSKINFEVYPGEIFGILGSSGSGKSTLLASMLFLHRPKSGEIEMFGENIWKLCEHDLRKMLNRCGVLFQFGALYSSLSVLENVGIGLEEYSLYSKKSITEVSKMWLEMVGLDCKTWKLYPHELSGGMKKRVGLARAMALNPEILFLDEPTSGLDPLSAGKFDELILKLREMIGLTIIMITHDLDSIQDSADRFILLKNSQIGFEGNLKSFIHKIKQEGLHEDDLFSSKRGERFWKGK